MIVGIFFRYIKTYQGINYIPLTNDDHFCGLVGDNGVGKSSILESIDCFFNDKHWNVNIAAKSQSDAHIVPVFLLKNELFSGEEFQTAKIISDIAWNVKENQINPNPSYKANFKEFSKQREVLIGSIPLMQLNTITQPLKRRFFQDFHALDKVQKTWVSKSGMLPINRKFQRRQSSSFTNRHK